MEEAATGILRLGDFACDKVLVEEEKGAALGGVVALKAGLPLAMARRYNYDIPSFNVPLQSEYIEGQLYVNGIEPGDRVTVIDEHHFHRRHAGGAAPRRTGHRRRGT